MSSFQWRCNFRTYQRALDILQQLSDLSDDYSLEAEALKEDLRILPGYPHSASEWDEVHPILIPSR